MGALSLKWENEIEFISHFLLRKFERQESIDDEVNRYFNNYLTLLKIFMRTRNRVTRSAIRPGTTSGLIRNDTHDTTTNIPEGR